MPTSIGKGEAVVEVPTAKLPRLHSLLRNAQPTSLLPSAMANSMIIVGAISKPGVCDFNLASVLIAVGAICIAPDIYKNFVNIIASWLMNCDTSVGITMQRRLDNLLVGIKLFFALIQVVAMLAGGIYVFQKATFVDLSDDAVELHYENFCEYSLFLTSCSYFGVILVALVSVVIASIVVKSYKRFYK